MAEQQQVPYVPAWGNVTKVLEKIIEAQTPPRFTQDFLETKLGMSGGGARPVIPFLKRTGFLATDGTPTPLYGRFRNASQRSAAAAAALKNGYARLYEVNEYTHDLSDGQLKGLVVQVTGADQESATVKRIIGTFKALNAFASFDGESEQPAEEASEQGAETGGAPDSHQPAAVTLGLGYTINLHLPATSDIAVFDAIFKSLREHILRGT